MCCNGFRGSRLTRMSRVTCPLDKRLYAQEGKRARGCWHMYTIVSRMTCAASVECILYMCCICCCSMHLVHVLKTGCSFNRLAELLFEGALSIVLPVSCRRKEAIHIGDVETLLFPDQCILATITRSHDVSQHSRGTSSASQTISCAL